MRVVVRPLGSELRRAVLGGLALGVLLAPGWVRLLELVR